MAPQPVAKEEGSGFFQHLMTTAASLVREAVQHADDTATTLPEIDGVSELANNITSNNTSSTSGCQVTGGKMSLVQVVVITLLYVAGILGNMAALWIINKSETQRYRKQTLMLRCLVGNDLVALLGSMVLMYVGFCLPNPNKKLLCACRVVFRAIGLGSGCVALVMAVERWLALTHPFMYPRHITHSVICRSIFALWLITLLLVCAPFLGFGLWYNENLPTPCIRYRNATEMVDRIYAFVIFSYGMAMCAIIVCCNLSVIRVLCRMRERLLPRRHSRASCRSATSTNGDATVNLATPEELSFARLMAILSITFVVCWVPQLMTIVVAQVIGHNTKYEKYFRIPDIFILLNFCLDPCMYVLFRRNRRYDRRHLLLKLITYLCPHLRNSPSRGILTDSLRSSTHTSQNNNGHAMGRNFGQRDLPLVMKGRSAVGSRYLPMRPLSARSTPLTRSCSSPLASQSFRLSPKIALIPCPRANTRRKLNSEDTNDVGMFQAACLEDKYDRALLDNDKRRISVFQPDDLELIKPNNQLTVTNAQVTSNEGAQNVIGKTSELRLFREHHLKILVRVNDGCGHANSHDNFGYNTGFSETCIDERTTMRNLSKRWSFCYGESNMLSLLSSVSKSTSTHDET